MSGKKFTDITLRRNDKVETIVVKDNKVVSMVRDSMWK